MKLKKIANITLILTYFTLCLFASFAHIHTESENHHLLSNESHHEHSVFCELFHAHIIDVENTNNKDYYDNEQYSFHSTINYSAHYPYQDEISITIFQSCLLKVKHNFKIIAKFINSPELPPPKSNLFLRLSLNSQYLFAIRIDSSRSSGLSPPNLL